MAIKYPVESLSAKDLYEMNEKGNNGWFPIGRNNFWHGGINLNFKDDKTGSKAIRAIAKGKIIAYRFTKTFFNLTKVYNDGEKKGVKYYDKDYSHNFVLIKHKHEPPNSPPIEYYSLYMHIAPFELYEKKYDENEVAIFTRYECEINEDSIFKGNALRNAGGQKIRIIPCGGAVSILEPPEGTKFQYKDADMPSSRKKASCTIWGTNKADGFTQDTVTGFIWVSDFDQNTWRCVNDKRNAGTNEIGFNDKGVKVYKKNDTTSEVIAVLPKGTKIYFVKPYDSIKKDKTIKPGMAEIRLKIDGPSFGFINVTSTNVKATGKVHDPVLSDTVQTCDIDITAGEIIGWPGKDGVAEKNSFHFEIFAKKDLVFGNDGNSGFWNISSGQGNPGGVFKINEGTAFSIRVPIKPVKNRIGQVSKIEKYTTLELVKAEGTYGTFPMVHSRKVKIVQQEKKEGWVLKSELSHIKGTGNNPGAKYTVDKAILPWMWNNEPATEDQIKADTRDVFISLAKELKGKKAIVTLVAKGTNFPKKLRKVKFTTLNPLFHFEGWIKNEDKVVGGEFTEAGTKKKRFYVKEDVEVYLKSPEYSEFKPSNDKSKQNIYIFKKDCLTAREKNGDVWIGIPKKFISGKDSFFDKDENGDIEKWLWLKEKDNPNLSKTNIFDWKEFFVKCNEGNVANCEDGFCDAFPIFELLDANKNGKFEVEEINKSFDDDVVKHKVRHLVVEHPSEWFFPSNDDGKNKRWKNRLQGTPVAASKTKVNAVDERFKEHGRKPPHYGFNFSDNKYNAFLEVAENSCFLHKIKGFKEDEKLWHFHPIAFVQHLKRLFGSLDIFEEIAKELDVEVAAIKAVAHVESRGDGFLPSGHPKILFESHQFRKKTRAQYDSSHPTLSHKYRDSEGNLIRNYLGGEEEVTNRLNVAISLNREAALKSASWGKFQIMGFNHKKAGYDTVEEFVTAMKEGLDNHYWAFANFVKYHPNMHKALKDKNWAKFAFGYNGEDYAANNYDKEMKKAYEKFKNE